MSPSIKNRDILPVGTRVKLAFDKLSAREGTVVGYDEEIPDTMLVLWDGNKYPQGGYFKPEIKPI